MLFHLKSSTPVVHPIGNRLLWVPHRHWTLTEALAPVHTVRDESPCGCYMRVRMCFGKPNKELTLDQDPMP